MANTLPWTFFLVLASQGWTQQLPATLPISSSANIRELLARPWGKMFWIERVNGGYRMGDSASKYSNNLSFEHLTFDISNNKVLANMGVQGTLKNLTIYRGSYGVIGTPSSLAGVWMAKDNTSFGPYSFKLHIAEETYDLANVNWDFRTGLLDNIFPVTELRDPNGRFRVRIVMYAPVSSDGSQRVRGVVYGLELENTASRNLQGRIELPGTFANQRQDFTKHPIHMWEPFEFEFSLGDTNSFQREIPFVLAPGKDTWVPLILSMPGDPVPAEVNRKGTLAWLAESWAYYRRVLGRLETSGDAYIAEFFERQVMQALQSIAMSPGGELAGTNWGTYPTTREIWMKDAYYSCLPTVLLDPSLAPPIILWFSQYGVRPKGNMLPGGLNHSLSLSLASIVQGGMYYENTADKSFFTAHPELKRNWDDLMEQLIASRTDPNIWLFPSRFISDGALEGDYHTGSNVVAWRALKAYSRLLTDVYGDAARGRRYAETADKVRDALLAKTVIDGPFGKQFIESVDKSGKPPRMLSDGEESDTTLMPFYGFLPYDNDTYLHYMHFSMSPQNEAYQPKVRAITWSSSPAIPLADRVPSTAPGYMKGIALGNDLESLFGEHGYYTEVRRVTDADGSVFWWPFGWYSNPPQWNYDRPIRLSIPGKAGWFAGVHTAVFISRYLGLSYDAPKRTLTFAPSPLLGNRFRWSGFALGNNRFSVSYEREASTVRVSARSEGGRAFRLELTAPVEGIGEAAIVRVDGNEQKKGPTFRFLGRDSIRVPVEVPAGKAVNIVIEGR
ncbi:MAG TPA: hypothetical protein VE398_08830 [Acidobacteriota bacterium]|nr:hypothetical protein [Acidobacteriota bacterium]